ncbi:LOW QUALITY PROTEIN: TBC1D2B isoform 10, partial [Pan troglodytes]
CKIRCLYLSISATSLALSLMLGPACRSEQYTCVCTPRGHGAQPGTGTQVPTAQDPKTLSLPEQRLTACVRMKTDLHRHLLAVLLVLTHPLSYVASPLAAPGGVAECGGLVGWVPRPSAS